MKPILLVVVMGAFMIVALHDQPVPNGKNEKAKKEQRKQKTVLKEDVLPKENIVEELFTNNLLW